MKSVENILALLKQAGITYWNSTYEEKSRLHILLSGVFGIVAAVFKLLVGIFSASFIWVYSCVYGIGLTLAKGIAYRGIAGQITPKKTANSGIAISIVLLFCGIAFNMCMMLKELMPSAATRFSGVLVAAASLYFVGAYIFAIRGLVQTRKNKGMPYFAIRIIGMSGALMNMVLLQRMIMSCTPLSDETILSVNSKFGYMTGGTLVLMAIILMARSLKEKKALAHTET